MKSQRTYSKFGFTLIEVIITLVIVAVVAAMMTAYFGTGITQSSIPIFRLSAAGKINRIMEKITAEYDQVPRWSPATAYTPASSAVIPSPSRRQDLGTLPNRYGYQYRCTTPGTSGVAANEPGWLAPGDTNLLNSHVCLAPPDPSCYVMDNGVKWELYAVAPLISDLQTKIGVEVTGGQDYTQTFGVDSISYRVIQNRFIKFVGTPPTEALVASGDPNDYLKVTIGLPLAEANRTDETLTTLFVRR